MSKLTRKQTAIIERALRNAERANAYIMRPDMAIGKLNGAATTSLHYTRADGSTFYALTKEYGSDLCGLGNCIAELRGLLVPAAQVTP